MLVHRSLVGRLQFLFFSRCEQPAERLALQVLEKHAAAGLPSQTTYLANSHGAEQLDQLLMPGAHQVDHAADGVLPVDVVQGDHLDGAVHVPVGDAHQTSGHAGAVDLDGVGVGPGGAAFGAQLKADLVLLGGDIQG